MPPLPALASACRPQPHHRVFDPSSLPEEAIEALEQFLPPPTVRVLSEGRYHADIMRRVLREAPVNGNLIHDAHLVAIALEHGVHEILTADADFRRFPQVRSRNPLA